MSDSDSELRISRRKALVLIAGAGAGAQALTQVGIATAFAAPTASESAVRGATTIMLIRHAERPTAANVVPFGINANGVQDNASLSVRGWQRAGALVELFDPSTGGLRPGLVRPTTVLAAQPVFSSQRPYETVTPVAERLGMTVQAPVLPPNLTQAAQLLARTPGAPLAAWEHQYIPGIAHALGNVHPTPPTQWPGNRFDVVWVFARRRDGWSFTQVPQLLLSGDQNSVIT